MAGAPLRNYKTFQELCGKDNFKNVILVTTIWDYISEKVGLALEEELLSDCWQPMIALGSTTHRFQGITESARKIINSLPVSLPASRLPLQIQQDMIDEYIPFDRTVAAMAVQGSLNGRISRWFGRSMNR